MSLPSGVELPQFYLWSPEGGPWELLQHEGPFEDHDYTVCISEFRRLQGVKPVVYEQSLCLLLPHDDILC